MTHRQLWYPTSARSARNTYWLKDVHGHFTRFTAGKIEQTIKQLVLFPNPSLSGKFLLKGAKTIDCLSVSDEFGKRVEATIEMYHDSLSIDLSEFANGIYELTIQDGSSIHYFELINLK